MCKFCLIAQQSTPSEDIFSVDEFLELCEQPTDAEEVPVFAKSESSTRGRASSRVEQKRANAESRRKVDSVIEWTLIELSDMIAEASGITVSACEVHGGFSGTGSEGATGFSGTGSAGATATVVTISGASLSLRIRLSKSIVDCSQEDVRVALSNALKSKGGAGAGYTDGLGDTKVNDSAAVGSLVVDGPHASTAAVGGVLSSPGAAAIQSLAEASAKERVGALSGGSNAQPPGRWRVRRAEADSVRGLNLFGLDDSLPW